MAQWCAGRLHVAIGVAEFLWSVAIEKAAVLKCKVRRAGASDTGFKGAGEWYFLLFPFQLGDIST